MISDFSKENDVILVRLVASNRFLYDVTHKDYKDGNLRNNVWEEIAAHFDGKTEDDCRKRWRSIRDTYKRLKRQNKLIEVKGKKHKWVLLKYLTFLHDLPEPEENSRKMPKIVKVERIEEEESDVMNDEEMRDPLDLNSESSSRSNSPTIPADIKPTSSSVMAQKLNQRSRNLKRLKQLLIENKQLKSKLKEKNEDEVDIFYKSLAMTVKRLPIHLMAKAKLENLQTVTKFELEATEELRDHPMKSQF